MTSPFLLPPGSILADKYEVVSKLGSGVEGEVFRIKERRTGVERAAKLFYPSRNPRNRAARAYARRLHRLRGAPIVIQYHASEEVSCRGARTTALISELVDGVPLSSYLSARRGRHLTPFEGLHLLHALAEGVEAIHQAGEYHGDIHTDNILVVRAGLRFDLKLVDLFDHGRPNRDARQWDVICMVRVFYDTVGGSRRYRSLPDWAKAICRGLKRSLILERFSDATALRRHLETLDTRS